MDLPDGIVRNLAAQGRDPARAAIAARLPSTYELDAFLKAHGVALEYSIDDFERDGITSTRLLRNRRDARQAPRQA